MSAPPNLNQRLAEKLASVFSRQVWFSTRLQILDWSEKRVQIARNRLEIRDLRTVSGIRKPEGSVRQLTRFIFIDV